MTDMVALRPGTILADEYRIERSLGAGGFGITYLAEEIALARLVTIKEYFPVDFAARDHLDDVVPRSQDSSGDYSWGLDRFLSEAQTLAKFNHPNIVRVYRYFLARNTGYIVLHYEDGTSLKGWLKGLGRAPRQPELDLLLEPLLDALATVHAADYLHRDIAPDNIMIRRDGQPVLIDFGSARGDIAKHTKTISALVKPGYSPFEQYASTSRQQGPWTDIYSLAATLYEGVTGRRPPDSPSRMVADEMVPPADAALSSYRPRFLAAIGKALRLDISERPRSVAEWRAELLAPLAQPADGDRKSPERKTKAKATVQSAPKQKPVPPIPPADATPPPAEIPVENKAPKQDGVPGAPRGGLAAAFIDGWRNAKAKTPPAAAAPVAPPPSPPKPKPSAAPARPSSAPPVEAAGRNAGTPAVAAPAPAAGARPSSRRFFPFRSRRASGPPAMAAPSARQPAPRNLRKRSGPTLRAFAAKLVMAVSFAAAAVAVQDYIPTVHREGAGVLTSHTDIEVPLGELRGHRGPVTGLAFSPSGHHLVTTSVDGTLKIWSGTRGHLALSLDLDSGPARALAVTDGRAATGHTDGSVTFWNIETGSKLATFRRNDSSVWSLAFAGNPDRVASATNDGAVAIWDIDQPHAPLRLFEGHSADVRSVAYAARGPFVATGGADRTVKLWNLETDRLIRTYRGHGALVGTLAFDGQGRTLAAASADGQIRLWSTYANRLRRRFKGHEGGPPALAFSPGGEHLISGGNDGMVRVWDIARGRLVRTLQGSVGPIGALGLSPDGRSVAIAGADGIVRFLSPGLPKEGS
jgi:serine/threonine protein kinase